MKFPKFQTGNFFLNGKRPQTTKRGQGGFDHAIELFGLFIIIVYLSTDYHTKSTESQYEIRYSSHDVFVFLPWHVLPSPENPVLQVQK